MNQEIVRRFMELVVGLKQLIAGKRKVLTRISIISQQIVGFGLADGFFQIHLFSVWL
jgi:hypothetical protein